MGKRELRRAVLNEVDGFIADRVVSLTSELIRKGTFDAQIETIVIDTIRERRAGDLTEVGFVLKMAVAIHDAGEVPFAEAKKRARAAYDAFLTESKVEFGDPAFDWSPDAAVTLALEYEIAYWEPAHDHQ